MLPSGVLTQRGDVLRDLYGEATETWDSSLIFQTLRTRAYLHSRHISSNSFYPSFTRALVLHNQKLKTGPRTTRIFGNSTRWIGTWALFLNFLHVASGCMPSFNATKHLCRQKMGITESLSVIKLISFKRYWRGELSPKAPPPQKKYLAAVTVIPSLIKVGILPSSSPPFLPSSSLPSRRATVLQMRARNSQWMGPSYECPRLTEKVSIPI